MADDDRGASGGAYRKAAAIEPEPRELHPTSEMQLTKLRRADQRGGRRRVFSAFFAIASVAMLGFLLLEPPGSRGELAAGLLQVLVFVFLALVPWITRLELRRLERTLTRDGYALPPAETPRLRVGISARDDAQTPDLAAAVPDHDAAEADPPPSRDAEGHLR